MMLTVRTARELAIDRIRERIDGLERELASCGKFRIGTVWHEDRVRELESFRATMARLQQSK